MRSTFFDNVDTLVRCSDVIMRKLNHKHFFVEQFVYLDFFFWLVCFLGKEVQNYILYFVRSFPRDEQSTGSECCLIRSDPLESEVVLPCLATDGRTDGSKEGPKISFELSDGFENK